MKQHLLRIRIEDSVSTCDTMMVEDRSVWSDLIPVKNRLLQVLPPDYVDYRDVLFPERGVVLTAKSLNLFNWNHDPNLPDGIYRFRYSVNPNDQVFITVNHFRTTWLNNALTAACIDHLTLPIEVLNDCGTPVQNDNEKRISAIIARMEMIPHLVQNHNEDLANRYYLLCRNELANLRNSPCYV